MHFIIISTVIGGAIVLVVNISIGTIAIDIVIGIKYTNIITVIIT